MKRRGLLALLPIPWLNRWLKPSPGMATTSLDLSKVLLTVYHGDGKGHSFVRTIKKIDRENRIVTYE